MIVQPTRKAYSVYSRKLANSTSQSMIICNKYFSLRISKINELLFHLNIVCKLLLFIYMHMKLLLTMQMTIVQTNGILYDVLQIYINSCGNIHIHCNKIIWIRFNNTCVQHYSYRIGNCMVFHINIMKLTTKTELNLFWKRLIYFNMDKIHYRNTYATRCLL